MKKKIIKTCVTALALASIFQSVTAYAARPPLFVGNVDGISGTDLKDVIMLQRYIAGLEEFSAKQLYVSDVNNDTNIDLNDVIDIQKRIAGLFRYFEKPDHNYPYAEIKNLYANYASGKAMAGVPVTFTAVPQYGQEPFRYLFNIDGMFVSDISTNSTLEYIFPQPGTYKVTVQMYNGFDDITTATINYEVVKPYKSDKPMVKAFYMDRLSVCKYDKNYSFIAEAFMGEGPYTYRFLLDSKEVTSDFTDKNSFMVEEELPVGRHTVTVQIKDKNSGDSYVSEDFYFIVTEAFY